MNLPFGFTFRSSGAPACSAAFVLAAAGLLFSAPAGAEPTKAAREASKQAFREARELWDGGNYLEACAKFEESYQHAPSVGNLVNLGRCAERRGKLATAKRYFERSAEMADTRGESERAEAARGLIAGLEPRLSRVEVSVDPQPDGVEVTLDGEPITLGAEPVALDPGEHRIAAYAPGYERDEARLEIQAEGELRTVTLTLTKLPGGGEAPVEDGVSGLMIGGIATMGVGAAGLVVGGVFWSMALSEESTLEDNCPVENACPVEIDGRTLEEVRDAGNQDANIATVGFAAGGVLMGVGLSLILVDVLTGDGGPPSDDVSFVPYLGPDGGGVGLRGRF